MITIKQFFATCGLNAAPERIKLVRHSGPGGRSIREIVAEGGFESYQAEQDRATSPFHDCDFILSFLGIERHRAEFHGVYRVMGARPLDPDDLLRIPRKFRAPSDNAEDRIWYELAEVPDFIPLRRRLITRWLNPRGWHQFRDLPVEQLLPPGSARVFPGFQDIVLTRAELREIILEFPELHRDWKVALSSTSGIYRIVDHSSGKIYIGAAYGAEGIWRRWKEYALTGHGGNTLLKDLDSDRFQWSIVRTLSGSMAPKEIIGVERIEMAKHGSLAIGLNLGRLRWRIEEESDTKP